MVFSSAVFLFLFLPAVLGICLILPARFRNCFLFAASLLFYAWGEPRYLFLMLFSAAFNYGCGLLLDHLLSKENKEGRSRELHYCLVVKVIY